MIKGDVFIQGFHGKLINRGMQSCARLIGGSCRSCREAVASESYRRCVYICSLLCVSRKMFNSNYSQHDFFFPQVKNEEKLGCGQAHFYRKMRKFGRGELELFLLLKI